jgi:hypothetical protein
LLNISEIVEHKDKAAMLNRAVPRREDTEHFPTILVVSECDKMRQRLVHALGNDAYLVLEADSLWSGLNVVQLHSRPIHLVLLDTSIDRSADFSSIAKQYRPYLEVVRVVGNMIGIDPDALPPESALARVQEAISLGKKKSAAAS